VVHSSFSTKLELLLNVVGLLSAVAAGSAQVWFFFAFSSKNSLSFFRKPLMTILFGNLAQSFIKFGTAMALKQAGDPNALQQALQGFKKDSARNALWLSFIGVFRSQQRFLLTFNFRKIKRTRRARVYYDIYVCMGVHR
jgi:ATP-binding cassette, subfamily B (MDR/TAP), member 1